MEPKKVRTATVITIVVAIVLILICLCLMFDWVKLPTGTQEKVEPTPEPTEIVEPADKPASVKKPGEHDLKGASEKLHHPKSENYLDEYKSMTVKAPAGALVYLQYKTEQIQYQSDAIMRLEEDAKVTAIAQENGSTLVLVQDGVAGWVPSYYLEEN
jgi:hypothetical protein